jgi:hypothetical protein
MQNLYGNRKKRNYNKESNETGYVNQIQNEVTCKNGSNVSQGGEDTRKYDYRYKDRNNSIDINIVRVCKPHLK